MVKRMEIVDLVPVTQPIDCPATKFGGQPNWLEQPEWPISKGYDCPMDFVGQVLLPEELFPGCGGRMAYLFLTSDEVSQGCAATWDAFAGENAVIIQPGGKNTTRVQNLSTGPTVQTWDADQGAKVAVEYAVELSSIEDEPPLEIEEDLCEMDDDEVEAIEELWQADKIGGVPFSWQCSDSVALFLEDDWALLLQVSEGMPFRLNFGGNCGVGHIFIDKFATQGLFHWIK